MTNAMETFSTNDVRIRRSRPLVSPATLYAEIPLPEATAHRVATARRDIADIVSGRDPRLMAVVGPCSIHDPDGAREYAHLLEPVAARLRDRLLIVMRVYFEKPRTVTGWKGLINDPDLDGTFNINKGLRLTRKLLLDIADTGLPAATEFLDTTFGQFHADLISWGAIGARTVESQVHRELVSGLSMPVGLKNRTDGDFRVAIDAIRAARATHWFPSLTKDGTPAILETTGNPDTHLVLRGGSRTGPNFNPTAIEEVAAALAEFALPERVMIDCSHDNSNKDPGRQTQVVQSIGEQISGGERRILGVMLESNLVAGSQKLRPGRALAYGQSITDACLGFEATVTLLDRLAAVSPAAIPASSGDARSAVSS